MSETTDEKDLDLAIAVFHEGLDVDREGMEIDRKKMIAVITWAHTV